MPIRFIDYGDLWNRFRTTYPTYAEHEPLAQVVDKVAEGEAIAQAEASEVITLLPVPIRLWFSNPDGYLVQVQADRFIFNWRRLSPEAEYPRFERLIADFKDALAIFMAFSASHKITFPGVGLCEATYVNHIPAQGANRPANLDRIITGLQTPLLSNPTAEPHSADYRLSFLPTGEDGRRGRLSIQIQPAFRRADMAEVVALNMIGRRRPRTNSLEHIVASLQDCHDWIVHAFKEVTRPEMHKEWGLEE